MTMYDRIRELRTAAGMTQDELARAMGYKDRSMITKIEAGKVDISQKKINAFAKVLNTTPAYLMGWTEGPKMEPITSISMPFHPDVMEAIESAIQEKETQRQIRDRERQDELKLIKIFDSLTSEGKQYLLQQADIAKKMFGTK